MTIYLACTVRGDRCAIAGLRSLVTALEAAGHEILTKHLLADDVDGAESSLTEREVYERDIRWLERCDVLVAEASGSSFGVGFEVGYVLGHSAQTKQRVVLLYRADRRDVVSRLIVGNAHPRCETIAYADAEELAPIVVAALDTARLGPAGRRT
jgi:2'-deoxynucleoside 5'-phosphate N-hydrolase